MTLLEEQLRLRRAFQSLTVAEADLLWHVLAQYIEQERQNPCPDLTLAEDLLSRVEASLEG